MDHYFTPGWITCLEDSMSFGFNNYNCTWFMFVPRKPSPFGNEYHNICCGFLDMLSGIELVEGKYHPNELGNPEYNKNGGTTCGLFFMIKG